MSVDDEACCEARQEPEQVSPWRIAVVGSLAGLGNGLNMNVMRPTLKYLHRTHDFDAEIDGTITASIFAGGAAGCFVGVYLSEALGRRTTTFIGESIIMLSALAQLIHFNPWLLLSIRLVLGFGVGICMLAKPLYMAELSPASIRGYLLSFNPFMYSFALFVIYATDDLVDTLPDEVAWRVMLCVSFFPAAGLFVFTWMFIPESPVWLRNQDAAAAQVWEGDYLKHATDQNGEPGESSALKEEIDAPQGGRSHSCPRPTDLYESISERPWLLKALGVGMALMLANQATGCTLFLLFATDLVKWTNVDGVHTWLVVVSMSAVLGAGAALVITDRLPRRTQLLGGLACLSLCTWTILVSKWVGAPGEMQMVGYFGALFFFCSMVGPAVNATVTEIFPNSFRSVGMGLVLLALYMVSIISQITFTAGGRSVETYLVVTGSFQVLILLLNWFIMPETRGIELSEVDKLWMAEAADESGAGKKTDQHGESSA